MREGQSVLEPGRALPRWARARVLLAVAVAAVPAVLVTGSELGVASGALVAAGVHPFALLLGTASALAALMPALERPRSRSLRAHGARLALRLRLTHAATARHDHQEQS